MNGTRRAGVVVLGAIAGVVALMATTGAIHLRESRLEAERFPRVGVAVDVGGVSMNARVEGEGHPAVVLDAGMGGTLHTWAWVQAEVARVTRVVSFDRPGMGYSEPTSAPRTADHMARELRGVLSGLGIPPPYVLVGHSLGGFTVRAFAALFPKEVAGVVFVDSTHEDEDRRLAEIGIEDGHLMDLVSVARFSTPLGGSRVLGALHLIPPLEVLSSMPEGLPDRVRAEFHRGAALDTYWRENDAYVESARWIEGAGDLGDLPLVVLSRDHGDRSDPIDAISAELQEELARLSTRGVVHEIPQSGHSSTVLAERHARVVSQTIIEMVEQVWRGDRSEPHPDGRRAAFVAP